VDVDRADLLNPRVVVALPLYVVGYAALPPGVPHSGPSAVSLPPASFPALLLARGDALFFASAYVAAVAAARVAER